MRLILRATLVAALAALVAPPLLTLDTLSAQGGRGGGRGGFGQADPNLPTEPTAVTPATISQEVTGPGTMYQSVQSLPPGRGLDRYGYEAKEYLVSGTAAGEPYRTRIVVRKPRDNARFSGLVFAEAMHPSGSAHIFEFTSEYSMQAGHAAIEIVVAGLESLTGHNAARYEGISATGAQTNEILAQVGAAVREGGNSPLAGLTIRKVVLGGTSATAAILQRYLPAHMVYRTPAMRHVYDGFMPHGTGATMQAVDVPLIEVPTMREVAPGNASTRQDSDEPGQQFRQYEFTGMAHVDSRDSVRFNPDPCVNPVTTFPLQAYLSVALDHLLTWVDEGVAPPRSPRVLIDRDTTNDGSLMALDAHGNPVGGIRNPYVDVPTAMHGPVNEAKNPVIPNASAYIRDGGQAAANQMCGLAGYMVPFPKAKLQELYGSKANYVRQVRARLDGMEAAGWSLPVYREMILGDAEKVEF
jgi:hypothetical protein